MATTIPRSIRFDAAVDARLRAYVAGRPGLSASATANRLVDEGLRMEEHPGVFFRDGPTGRRAVVAGGPDVWQVIQAVRSARAANPAMSRDELIELLVRNTGVPQPWIQIAIRYWSEYPYEIDERIRLHEEIEDKAEEAWRRQQGLLAG